MTRRISYSREAESDLREITNYTQQTWGDEQAREYLDTLSADIAALSDHAMRHRRFDEVKPGLRRVVSGHHFVFYLANVDRILIVRVLHERRDFASLFD